ncbi:MAG: hypothetical protein K2O03_13685 [Lachnospiraceae bacterium]|nr:hypothetical protein [Lachnospiraceae bacterium]
MIDIYDNTRKENDWIHIQDLFFEFLHRVQELEDDICFAVEYYFVSIVFGQRDEIQEFNFLTVIARYMDKVERGDMFRGKDVPGSVLLWGMLAASIPYAKEEELINFLRNFSDFGKRSRYSIRYTKKEIDDSVIGKECAIMLVLLEGWLEFHDAKRKELAAAVKKIYERGEKVFENFKMIAGEKAYGQEGAFGLYDFILLYETIGDRSLDMKNILDRFLREKRLKVRVSFVSYLIETV